MKNITLLIASLLLFSNLNFSQTTRGEIAIGNGNQLTSLPIYPAFNFSYSQSIYLQSELGAANTISKIWYQYGGMQLENSRQWTIYMGHTQKTQFDTQSDWIDVNTLTPVFTGTFPNQQTAGWIEFDISDFSYNGSSNLVIAVDENAPNDDFIADNYFICTSRPSNRSLLDYSDSDNIDPASPPSNSLLKSSTPNIKLFMGAYPLVDTRISALSSPTGYAWSWLAGAEDITIRLENKGQVNLLSTTINWSVNGNSQTPFEWTGSLAPEAAENVTIGNFDFSAANNYTIQAVSVNSEDGNPANDTATTIYKILNGFTTNYNAGFEEFTFHSTPEFWELETHSVAWMVDDRLSHSGENCLRTFYNEDATTAKDDWAYSPYIKLVGGSNYSISFWLRALGYDGVPEGLEFFVGSSPASANMTNSLWADANISTTGWEQISTNFTPTETGNYIFGWHANSIANVDDISIDDFLITGQTAKTASLPVSEIKIYPNPTSEKVQIQTATPCQLSITNLLGQEIYKAKLDNKLSVMLKQPGVYLLNFSTPNSEITKKLIVK